ncbi:50S ribosomal protein L35 [Striga asiatica]|uniref:50S ribosomal protein L35 n=1 Tax=Striga asiatica TaxID=4170 RepID=A0A5A7PV69_STRAF|nr:50S ribosomal protein L35 [Striga asiatica]
MTSITMATTVYSFGLRTQFPNRTIRSAKIQCMPFNKNPLSLSLSSSYSICGLRPLVLSKTSTLPSSVRRISRPLTVVCAVGYKMKTHKASAKRFRVTGSGKIMRRRAGKQHLLRKKNTKRRLRLSKTVQVDRSDYNNVIGALPYLKVNRLN